MTSPARNAPPAPAPTRIGTAQGTAKTFALMMGFCLLGLVLTGGRVIEGAIIGFGTFLIYRIGVVRMILCRNHRAGIGLSRDGDFAGALHAFTRSEADWTRLAWLDARRGWLLGSSARWSFHAQALYNQAYCLSQMGHIPQALAVLEETIRRYPDMRLARQLRERLVAEVPLHHNDWNDLLDSPPDAP